MTNMTNDLMTDAVGELFNDAALDQVVEQIQVEGLELLGPDGVLTGLTSRLLSKMMNAELTNHLGYERGDRAGWGSGNSRNGRACCVKLRGVASSVV